MSPVFIITFLIIFVAIAMVALLFFDDSGPSKEKNLAKIRGKSYDPNAKVDDGSAQSKRLEELSKKLQGMDSEDDDKKDKVTISGLMEQAGIKADVKKYWMFSIGFAVGFTLLLKLSGQGPFVLAMCFITALLGFPKMFLKRKIRKRQQKFLEEFPDALEAMVRLLKSGMPVTEAISMAGREYTGPVGEEMLRIYDAQKVGVSLPDATADAAKRMPITEMQMFATGIAIQVQTGASLSEVLMNLSGVIRARFKLKRKVQALSSEAKASAGIIGCLPFLVGGGLTAINPEYMDPLFFTTIGKVLLIGSAVWMGTGIMVMKVMINFKI